MQLTQARLRELFDYTSEGNLIWRVTNSNRAQAGSIAGYTRNDGYKKIRFDGNRYYAHRIVFFWHYGLAPAVIDHIDGNPSNNRIENLRAADMRLNQGNRNGSRPSLPKGVDWKPKIGKWQARITVDRRQVYLGAFDSPEKAHAAYVKAAQQKFGVFYRA